VQNTFGAAAFTSYGAFWMGFALLQILAAVSRSRLCGR
jgi:succinate-acetate transporter protein